MKIQDENNIIYKSKKNKCFTLLKYVLIYTLIFFIFSILFKERNYEEYTKGEKQSIYIEDTTIVQNIPIINDNPLQVGIKISNNSNDLNYKIKLLDKDEVIESLNINSNAIQNNEYIYLDIPKGYKANEDGLKIQIEGEEESGHNELSVEGYLNDDDNNLTINNVDTDLSLTIKVMYEKFTNFYLITIICAYIFGIAIIWFLVNKGIKEKHNLAFLGILAIGGILSFVNPILDTPDDNAHIERAELTSRGFLYLGEESDTYKVSKSVNEITNHIFTKISNTKISQVKIDSDYEYEYNDCAKVNIFIGYIPQAIGIILGKLIGRIPGIGALGILVLGKLMNLLSYALMVRFAIKKTPLFKVPISIIAMMPMAVYIAASFNPDAMTYGVGFIIIAYFLSMYEKEKLESKDLIIYTLLCILMTLLKLPYCILGGIILFLPKDKYKDKKIVKMVILSVAIIILATFGWAMSSMISSSSFVPRNFKDYFEANNVSSSGQITYILSNFKQFLIYFTRELIENIGGYIEQINTWGWLSYQSNPGITTTYPIFIGAIILLYPNEITLSRRTKIGIFLVSVGIYALVNLTLYLSHTSVGSSQIIGMQGRYFVPLIALITLLSGSKKHKLNDEKQDMNYIFAAFVFLSLLIPTVMSNYY